jgi:hypothetical protein
VSSGLLPIVAIDAPVFRRSAVVVAAGGDSGFLLELFLDSQAKGPVSFLVVVGDILPERPCSPLAEFVESRESRGGSLGSMPAAFEPSVKRQLQFCDQHAFTHADAYVGGASEWVQMAPALEV